jgi:hypothetical protein
MWARGPQAEAHKKASSATKSRARDKMLPVLVLEN